MKVERPVVAGECYRGEHGAVTASAGGRCEGSAEQEDGLEGERARSAGLCMQRDREGSKNVTGKLRSGRIGEPIVG